MDDSGRSEAPGVGLGGYWPRDQFRTFHVRTQRWAVGVAHRRAGKTVASIADLTLCAAAAKKPASRFGFVAPLFNQAKDIAWPYVKMLTADLGADLNESELRADLPNGSRIRLYGADNYDRMRGLYFDGLVLDEYGDQDPRAWAEVLRPALTDRQGWALFIGTPKGKNGFWKIWSDAQNNPEWFTFMLKASQTGLVSAAELADARKAMTDDQYAQEFECSFDAAVVGAYYGKLIAEAQEQGRVTIVPYDSSSLVTTAWDFGVDDSTSIWFEQRVGLQRRVIDYYENNGQPLAHYAAVLKSKGYAYGDHVLPHDAGQRRLGKDHVHTIAHMLDELDVKPNRTLLQSDVEGGIEAARRLIPQSWFDQEKCRFGVEALKQYRKQWDDKLKTFRQTPLHDWSSHGADAFRYLALGLDMTAPTKREEEPAASASGWMG